jgi:hypothetical protein
MATSEAIYTWAVYRTLDGQPTGVSIKSSPGQVGGWYLANNAASPRYVKLYDKASAPSSSDVPKLTIPVPANSAANLMAVAGIDLASTSPPASASASPPAWPTPTPAPPRPTTSSSTCSTGDPMAKLLASLGAGGAGGAFDPSTIAGLVLWLKSDAGLFQDAAGTTPASADGDPVGRWADQSGQGNHLTQATAAKRPTLKLAQVNGRSAVQFVPASSTLLASAAGAVTGSGARTLFLVTRAVALGTMPCLFDFSYNDAAALASFTVTPEVAVRISGGNRVFTSPLGTTAYQLLSLVYAAASDIATVSAWLNGSALSQAGAASATPNTSNTGMGLGWSQNVAEYYSGLFAEVLAYNSALAAADRQNVESYLNSRYALF